MELSKKHSDKIALLNLILFIVEQNIKDEALREVSALENIRTHNPIDDYEMPLNISYWSDKDEYITEATFHDLKSIYDSDFGIGDSNDHGNGCAPYDMKHCYLLHSLYDHQDIKLEDMLRIKKVTVLCNRVYQKCFDIKDSKKVSFARLNEELIKAEKWIHTMNILVDNWVAGKFNESCAWKPVGHLKLSLSFHLGKSSRQYRKDDDNIYVSLDDICIENIKASSLPEELISTSRYCRLFNMLQEKLTSSMLSGFSNIAHTEMIWVDLSFGYFFAKELYVMDNI